MSNCNDHEIQNQLDRTHGCTTEGREQHTETSGRDSPEDDASAPVDAVLLHGQQVIRELFGEPAERSFEVRYWNGTRERAGTGTSQFTLVINRPGALRRMLLPPSELSIVEAYLSGDVDVEGELELAVTIADAINSRIKSPRTLAALTRHLLALPRTDEAPDVRSARAEHTVEHVGRQHDKSRDKAAIRYHYDVGNDFYSLWLDDRMVYSCGYFRSPDATLNEAQEAKLDLICRKLRLLPGDRLLDVGCGWGGLIMHAVKHYDVNALGITLSEAQASLARERIGAAGLSDRCRVEIRDYRDLPAGVTFDKIASVGMVEHVGVKNLPTYFACVYNALAPGGLFLNHGIVSVNAARPQGPLSRIEGKLWKRDAFIDQYVFPDGRLGPLGAVIAAAEGAGFETRDMESLREHYTLTLRAWTDGLVRNADRAIELSDERTYRTWLLYMTASAFGFASGSINVVQTLLSKPDQEGRSHLPLTREDLYSG